MELRALRLGAGATPDRIVASAELHRRLGRPPSGEAVAVLSAYLRELGDGIEARALWAAFALANEDGNDRRLAGRRSTFGRKAGLLPDAIERFEAVAINRLVELLALGGT